MSFTSSLILACFVVDFEILLRSNTLKFNELGDEYIHEQSIGSLPTIYDITYGFYVLFSLFDSGFRYFITIHPGTSS